MGRSNRSQAEENRARILQGASGLFRAHCVEVQALDFLTLRAATNATARRRVVSCITRSAFIYRLFRSGINHLSEALTAVRVYKVRSGYDRRKNECSCDVPRQPNIRRRNRNGWERGSDREKDSSDLRAEGNARRALVRRVANLWSSKERADAF